MKQSHQEQKSTSAVKPQQAQSKPEKERQQANPQQEQAKPGQAKSANPSFSRSPEIKNK